jgi:hypothetical protein
MKRTPLITAAVLISLGCVCYWATADRLGPALTSEPGLSQSSSGIAESSDPQAPRTAQRTAGGLRSAARAPHRKEVTNAARMSATLIKGQSLFEGQVLARPRLSVSTVGAVRRADEGARAQALAPRAERRLARLRSTLAVATGERKRRLQIAIESLERNLERRRERERFAPDPAVGSERL